MDIRHPECGENFQRTREDRKTPGGSSGNERRPQHEVSVISRSHLRRKRSHELSDTDEGAEQVGIAAGI